MDSRTVWLGFEAALVRRGVKRKDMARAMDISERTLTERRKNPGDVSLREIEKALNKYQIPIREIFDNGN